MGTNELKSTKAITLITLVITIVILLILAGVSIMAAVGDNGLLSRTLSVKKHSDEADVIESIQLAYINAENGIYEETEPGFINQMKEYLEAKYGDIGLSIDREDEEFNVIIPGYGKYLIDEDGDIRKIETAEQVAQAGENSNENTVVESNTTTENTVGNTLGNTTTIGEITEPEETEQAGVYDDNNNLLKTWEELVENGNVVVDEDGAFIEYHKVESATRMVIDSSVTFIGSEYGRAQLHELSWGITRIEIPNSVTGIGHAAFDGCSRLTSITIPDSVTKIEGHAFSGCEALTSIAIPNNVTSIGSGAFKGCSGLASIVVEEGNSKYDSRNNCNAIIEKDTNKLIAGCKNTIVLNTVTSIDGDAFQGCISLTNIVIPDSVTSLGTHAFMNCSGLKSVVLPDSLTELPGFTFAYCSSLTSITIPKSITQISWGVLKGCSSLTNIVVEEGNSKYDSRNNCNAIIDKNSNVLIAGCKNTIIPNSVVGIERNAFEGCSGLTSIVIPNSITSIGQEAFENCTGLTSVTIPNSITVISNYLFYSCSGLTSVVIPDSVTEIGYWAFGKCSGLTNITVPNSVTKIGNRAFQNVPWVIYNGTATGSPWGATKVTTE